MSKEFVKYYTTETVPAGAQIMPLIRKKTLGAKNKRRLNLDKLIFPFFYIAKKCQKKPGTFHRIYAPRLHSCMP